MTETECGISFAESEKLREKRDTCLGPGDSKGIRLTESRTREIQAEGGCMRKKCVAFLAGPHAWTGDSRRRQK